MGRRGVTLVKKARGRSTIDGGRVRIGMGLHIVGRRSAQILGGDADRRGRHIGAFARSCRIRLWGRGGDQARLRWWAPRPLGRRRGPTRVGGGGPVREGLRDGESTEARVRNIGNFVGT